MIDILLLVAGLALILVGANFLVDGASSIAKKFGISEFIIGMTIVGIGTSTPEMVVSFLSAAQGNADIAVGNVVGSNIFNILMILGITALIAPVPLTSNNIKKDIPFSLLAAFVLVAAGADIILDGASTNMISRAEGLMLLALFGVFIAYTIYSSGSADNTTLSADSRHTENALPTKAEQAKDTLSEKAEAEKNTLSASSESNSIKPRAMWLSAVMVLGGLAGLVVGGEFFVKAASAIARMLGVSDAVIAITIMAGGTSLPELASCVVAAMKKNTDLALGNVVGSNISNIFLILGGSAVIHPLGMSNIGQIDLGMLLISAILLFITAFTFKKKTIDRAEGIIFILLYIASIVFIIKNGII